MAHPYRVVVIDDDPKVRDDLLMMGRSAGFDIFAYSNLEAGMEKLREDSRINGLILDAEGKLTNESGAALTFLPEAVKQLEALISSRDRDIFTIINTVFFQKIAELYGDMFTINNKEDPPQKLFEDLKEGIDDLELTFIRRKYAQAIDQFHQIMGDPDREEKLVSILTNMKREDPDTIEKNLGQIRKVYEALMGKIEDALTLPANLHEREKIKYLSGIKYYGRKGKQAAAAKIFPEYITDICFALWGLGSAASHDNEDEIHCTQHTVIGSTHLLLDLINWVSKWLDRKSD